MNAGTLSDLVFLTRPQLLCVSAAFFFAGASRAIPSPAAGLRPSLLAALAHNFALYILIVASSFVINQIYDVESDRLNRKNFLLPSNLVRRSDSLAIFTALVLASVLLSIRSASPVREIGLAGLVLGIAYSVPPLRLKGRPMADMAANGLGFGFLGFALGWLALLPYESVMLLKALPYVVAMCAIFLNTTIPDEPGDRAAGDRTACLALGPRRTARLALLLLLASGVLGMAAGEAQCSIAAAASLPAFIAVAFEAGPAVSVVASQFAGRAFFFLVSAAVPALAIMGAVVYAASRAYYSRRLGMDYPRIGGARLAGPRSVSK
jgi:4-hydroxybenzoate polyprenyltransferase